MELVHIIINIMWLIYWRYEYFSLDVAAFVWQLWQNLSHLTD